MSSSQRAVSHRESPTYTQQQIQQTVGPNRLEILAMDHEQHRKLPHRQVLCRSGQFSTGSVGKQRLMMLTVSTRPIWIVQDTFPLKTRIVAWNSPTDTFTTSQQRRKRRPFRTWTVQWRDAFLSKIHIWLNRQEETDSCNRTRGCYGTRLLHGQAGRCCISVKQVNIDY